MFIFCGLIYIEIRLSHWKRLSSPHYFLSISDIWELSRSCQDVNVGGGWCKLGDRAGRPLEMRGSEGCVQCAGTRGAASTCLLGRTFEWQLDRLSSPGRMCEPESVEYLRDLFREKENIEKLEGHHIIKSLLNQGKIICYKKKTLLRIFARTPSNISLSRLF